MLSLRALLCPAAAFGIGFLCVVLDKKANISLHPEAKRQHVQTDPTALLPPVQPVIICLLLRWPDWAGLDCWIKQTTFLLPSSLCLKNNCFSALTPANKIKRMKSKISQKKNADNLGLAEFSFCKLFKSSFLFLLYSRSYLDWILECTINSSCHLDKLIKNENQIDLCFLFLYAGICLTEMENTDNPNWVHRCLLYTCLWNKCQSFM